MILSTKCSGLGKSTLKQFLIDHNIDMDSNNIE